MSEQTRTTPEEVSEFDREQLRFFLASSDMAVTLAEFNPSLAWLPKLAELNLLKNDGSLVSWVEKNFESADAVREVVANLRFFNKESADILEYRLNHRREQLPLLFIRCWQLIIRHIRNAKQGLAFNEWYDLLPRIKRGDFSAETLDRIVAAATPTLKVEKRFGFYDDEKPKELKAPSDLMRIVYGVDDEAGESEFLAAWPKSVPATIEHRLIVKLTGSLEGVLADAEDVGVEGKVGVGISDIDVPSVADHPQNAHHHGFNAVIRLITELWTRLAGKKPQLAMSSLHAWESSEFRLLHRLALFAAENSNVSPAVAANVLLNIPQGELFFASSVVEVHRLIRKRWGEFSLSHRQQIEERILIGPPLDWYQPDANVEDSIDRKRFELLFDLENSGVALGAAAHALLTDIRKRRPRWKITEPEKLGFMMWSGGISSIVGKPEKLKAIPSSKLVEEAQKVSAKADFMEGDAWQALCQSEPTKAFEGIENAGVEHRWHQWAWRPLFWSANKILDEKLLTRIAELFVQWPDHAPMNDVSNGAAWWLDEVASKLKSRALWRMWDFLEKRATRRIELVSNDYFSTALNDTAGHLASILLKRTPKIKGNAELGNSLRVRYNKLVSEGDLFSLLARVRFAAAVAFLFERAPNWTAKEVISHFSWSSPDAAAMWSARKYSNHIGSEKLFELTKQPFLEMFSRNEVSSEDRRAFGDWLGAILIANQAGTAKYDLRLNEVRAVLRRAGGETISSFAHRMAIEMESAKKEEKIKVWEGYVGPVFKGAWPLDVELQSPRYAFKLVQLLRATGPAFPDAIKVVLPFIRAEDPRGHTTIYSLSHDKDELYSAAPDRMLDLLAAIVGDAPQSSIYGLRTALDKLKSAAPHLVQTMRFRKLESQASPHA